MSLLKLVMPDTRVVTEGSGFTPLPGGALVAAVNGVVWDENTSPTRYAGFPYGGRGSDNALISTFKVSYSHGGTGPLTFSRSTQGGAAGSWAHKQITIEGVGQVTSAFVTKVTERGPHAGRIVVAYQDNDGEVSSTYQDMKTAYSDNQGVTWHQGGAWNWNEDGLSRYIASLYGDLLELPSGKLLLAYYKVPNTGYSTLPSIIGTLESTDGGVTWTQGAIMASHRGAANGYPDEPVLSETGWEITHDTGVDSTCKIVAFVRNEDGTGWLHFRSPDGGGTWERLTGVTWVNNVDYANDRLYDLGTSVFARYPLHLKKYNGKIYILAGARLLDEANQFKGVIEYITATPDDVYNNVKTGYSPRTQVAYDCQADNKTAALDFGYCPMFVDAVGNLVVHLYDASNDPSYPGSLDNKRVMIYQQIIDTPL